MSVHDLKASDLRQFTGTERWFRHALAPDVVYTEGVQHVAEHGGAYWLIDAIVFAQIDPRLHREDRQFWKLQLDKDGSGAELFCTDGGKDDEEPVRIYTQKIPFTDFPLAEIDLWFMDNTILLPSEY